MTATDGCAGHAPVGEELRALVLTALDRVDPVLERLRTGAGTDTDGAVTCAACPVCALVAALRGERPELAVRLAEHGAGLVAVLRAALQETGPAPAAAAPEPGPARRVQHIRVDRQAR